jgi:hypothetical protein
MLVIVCCLALLIFWVSVSRINPEKYPYLDHDTANAWQNLLLSYCRRFTGLLLIWIVLAIGNGVLLNQAYQNGTSFWHGLYYTFLVITTLYLLGSLAYIIISVFKIRKWAKAHKVWPKPKT